MISSGLFDWTEFAAFLFLIVLFPTTLIPASLLGLSMTIASLVFAHVIGNWVDRYPRLWVARWALFVQKVSPLDLRARVVPT
jgi:iron-regulated transporter 1